MGEVPVLLDIVDDVATITLNRPDAGNAVNMPLALALLQAAIRCQTDDRIRCVVLTGAGRLFCAGGDIAAFEQAGNDVAALLSELAGTLHMAMMRLSRMRKPLVTLVNGPAAGAGFGLALMGDIAVCGDSASFTPAYGKLGLTPDGGLSWLLPRLVGLRRAQEIILMNKRVKADEAERIGLVTRRVADELLLGEGRSLASSLVAAATGSLGVCRGLLRESFESSLECQLEREVVGISGAGAGAEAQEGLSAYFAKRQADFRSI